MEEHNQNEVFCEGRNVEEALQAACDRLGTTPNQVDYEVVESGASGGMLGFLKGKTYRIRVWRKSEAQRKLTDLIRGFCDAMNVGLTFQVARGEDGFEVTFETEGSDGLLIGRGGETLAALQHLVTRMASRLDEDLRVRVDVAGYRRRRQDQLRRHARELAEQCLGEGREMVTEPLPADERRVVHLALAEDPRVETRALGEGLTKRVAVVPTASGATGKPAERGESFPNLRGRGRGSRFGRERRGREGRDSRERSGDEGRVREARPAASAGGAPSSGPRLGSGRGRHGAGSGDERHGGHRSERSGRSRRPDRRREPAARPAMSAADAEPVAEDLVVRPAAAAAGSTEEPRDESYFRIPESIGLVTPAPQPAADEGEPGEPEDKPITFGRRPRAARRRGR